MITVPFKDGPIDLPFVADFAWHVTLLLAQQDRPPISGFVSLQILDTKGAGAVEAIHAYNERRASSPNRKSRRSHIIPASEIEPVVVIVVAAEDLEPDSKWPMDRPRTESLKCYPGHKTPLGLLVPGLNLVPERPKREDT